MLTILLFTLDLLKFFPSVKWNSLGLKLLDFILSGFVVEHEWIKCSSILRFSTLEQLYENCLKSLEELKLADEKIEAKNEYYSDNMSSWDKRPKIELQSENSFKVCETESNFQNKKDIIIILLHHSYQKLVAWNTSSLANTIPW